MLLRSKMFGLIVMLSLSGCCSQRMGNNSFDESTKENIKQLGHNNAQYVLTDNVIYFNFDSSNISLEAKDKLLALVKELFVSPDISVVIEGYCDITGTTDYNVALGLKRASSVQKFLIAEGITHSRLEIVSYGDQKQDGTSRKLNRKVYVVIK